MVKELPIDLVPGARPLKFRWKQRVDSMVGKKTVECEGGLPLGIEVAVAELIAIAKHQATALEELRKDRDDLLEKLTKYVNASEAEVVAAQPARPTTPTAPSSKKPRG